MYRIGQSTDIHRFKEGTFITVGGEQIPFHKGVVAHSDGDALCHAIAESMLGALALKDLGTHFPDTDPLYKDISSLFILKEVYAKIEEQGYELVNLDALILIEQPKMAPYIDKIQANISDVLGVDKSQVSIKATRGEQLGPIGRSEGFVCQSVVLLRRRENL